MKALVFSEYFIDNLKKGRQLSAPKLGQTWLAFLCPDTTSSFIILWHLIWYVFINKTTETGLLYFLTHHNRVNIYAQFFDIFSCQ